jgi:NTP pyrophosphatase (non-canonical NTP hydrolase)
MTQQELFKKLTENASLKDIQAYIKNVIALRGFGGQSAQSNMLLLLEETGELAKAIRKSFVGMSVDETMLHRYDTVESEVADIFIVLMSICNTLNVDLYEALKEKEKINCERNWTVNKKA